MTADEMAEIHRLSMTMPRPWNVPTFKGFMSFPGTICVSEKGGFALGRVIADESELLTIAVRPDARRQGIAARCLKRLETAIAERGGKRIFLEVAETNEAAKALYLGAGYENVGTRPDYYKSKDGMPVTALMMVKRLSSA